MKQPFLTARAEADLDEIWDYITNDSVRYADRLLDELYAKAHLLAENPGIGRPRPEFGPDVRSFPHGNYIIFYRPVQLGVEVLRFIRGERDLHSL